MPRRQVPPRRSMKKKPKQENPDETPTPATLVAESGEADDTEVAPALDDDEWDGPTREVAAEEVAAMAMKSTAAAEAHADVAPEAFADAFADAAPEVLAG